MAAKLMSMREAIGRFVGDGETLVIEGFAAGHEITRQRRRTSPSDRQPFMPLRSYRGSDLPAVNPAIPKFACHFTG
jgi:hypothetical protein